MVVGCGKGGEITIGEPPKATPTDQNTTKANPAKELTLREKLVGAYEAKVDKRTFKGVFLENGKAESYKNGEKDGEGTWKIVGNEVHVSGDEKPTTVFKIKPNCDLTFIATINKTGKREGVLKRDQSTFKKIK